MSAIAIDQHELLDAPELDLEVPGFVEAQPPRLHAVAPVPRRRAFTLRYAIAAIVGIAVIAAVQVSIALVTTQESFVLADRMQTQRELAWEQQALESVVIGLGSPQALAQQASNQGLVVNGSPHYLRLSDGVLIGSTDPAMPWSVVAPRNASVANALIDTPAISRDQAAWDAVFAAGVKPQGATVLSTPQLRKPVPVVAGEAGGAEDAPDPVTDGEPQAEASVAVEGEAAEQAETHETTPEETSGQG